jgi:hypothetical protein
VHARVGHRVGLGEGREGEEALGRDGEALGRRQDGRLHACEGVVAGEVVAEVPGRRVVARRGVGIELFTVPPVSSLITFPTKPGSTYQVDEISRLGRDVGSVLEVLDAELDGLRGLGEGQADAGHEELAVAVGGAEAGVERHGGVQRGDDLGHDAGLLEAVLEVERADADGIVVGHDDRGQRQGGSETGDGGQHFLFVYYG